MVNMFVIPMKRSIKCEIKGCDRDESKTAICFKDPILGEYIITLCKHHADGLAHALLYTTGFKVIKESGIDRFYNDKEEANEV